MDPRSLLESNVGLIDSIVGRVCRRARMYGADAEDFAAAVKLALIENDYAILRRFEGRASLSTYITIIVERLMADEYIRSRGRWHPSVEAVRLGAPAVLLETLVVREKRSLEEALPLVQAADPAMTRESAEALLARLPERRARPVATDIEDVPETAFASSTGADAGAMANEARRLSERAARVMREALAAFTIEDRTLVRFRFGSGMSIADISRMLRLPQRPLYRRLEALLQRLRDALQAAGLDAGSAEQIIENAAAEELDFGLMENDAERQTNQRMEQV
jgi:RNA polymerase sigma factor for flagellar operon FliA